MKNIKRSCLVLVLVVVSMLLFTILNACASAVEFKVDFIVDGEVYHTINTAGNTKITMPDNPTKDGYTFDGWYWDENEWKKPFTVNSLLDAPLSSDMKVFARFTINQDSNNEQENSNKQNEDKTEETNNEQNKEENKEELTESVKKALVDSTKINLILDTYYFAQGDVDLEKAFPEKNITVEGANASISGKTLTVTGAGEFTLNDGTKSYKGVAIDNAANVATFEEYVNAMTSKKHICLQSDITEIDTKFITVEAFEDHGLQSNVYGNGHYVCVNKVAAKWYSILDVRAKDILIRDIHVSAYHVEPGADIDLTTFENIAGEKAGAGAILNITGPYSATVKHCAFENGHKVAFIREGQATIEDCVFRNASDTLISIETSSCKGAEVTLKNNLLANAVVAGVCLWGWTAASGDESYVTLNVEGFLDIYNWKEGSTAKLMPGTEQWAGLVNPMVAKEFDKEQYEEYFYVEEDGSKYIHCAIVKLCTAKLKANNATINGIDGVNFEIREFPLPNAAKIACNECQVIGYGNTDSVVDIRPIERLTHNKNASKIGIEFILS